MKPVKRAKKHIRAACDKWLKPLGLLWWDVTVSLYDDPVRVLEIFGSESETTVAARCFADWRYGTGRILVNVLAFVGLEQEEVERILVHEMVHILVNEMREDGIDHEERVVSTLTKAFFWVEASL